MVKEFNGTYKFPFNWNLVVSCFWVKYPNPFSKHVLSEDVFSRFITDKNVLITRKLLVKERTFHIPKWAEKFVHVSNVYVVEESHIDPAKGTLTSYTKNFSSNSLMTVVEKCVYSKDPNNPNMTLCSKQAHIYSPLLFGAGSAIEQFAVKRFKKNADKATLGLNWIIEKFKVKMFQNSC